MTATAVRPLRTLSKSDFTLALTCEAKLYFRENRYPDRRESDPYLLMLAQGGYMVEALAKAHYAEGIALEYGRDPCADFERTRDCLSRDHVTLFEATLLDGRRLARVDILQKEGNAVRLLEVKSSSFDGAAHAESLRTGGTGVFLTNRGRVVSKWEQKLADLTYQVLLFERLFPQLSVEPFLFLVDRSKRAQMNNIPDLFTVERRETGDGRPRLHTAHFRGDQAQLPLLDLVTAVSVAREVDLLREEVAERAAAFELLLDSPLSAFSRPHGSQCKKCEFRADELEPSGFHDCWGELATPSPHVLDLHRIDVARVGASGMVESLVQAGTTSLFDVPLGQLRRRDGVVGSIAARQIRQIECMRSGDTWVGPGLREQLERVVYPAHFVDFEVARLALPYHARMRPYGQIAFQWSSHRVDSSGGAPIHGEWLNDVDEWPNERFVRTLRAEIGDSGSVIAWSPFEHTTLKEVVAELHVFGVNDRELSEWIEDVQTNRIFDLHKVVAESFYHPGMRDRTGIKYVLDALWPADERMRALFSAWTGRPADADVDPYAALDPLMINGELQDVREGTGAIRAYEAMMYGAEKREGETKARWRRLLLQYCALDSLSMVLIYDHLQRAIGGDGSASAHT